MDHPPSKPTSSSSPVREGNQQQSVTASTTPASRISDGSTTSFQSIGSSSSAAGVNIVTGAETARSPLRAVEFTNSSTRSASLPRMNVGSELQHHQPLDQQQSIPVSYPGFSASSTNNVSLSSLSQQQQQQAAMSNTSNEQQWSSVTRADEISATTASPWPPLPPTTGTSSAAVTSSNIRSATGAGGTRQRLHSDPYKEGGLSQSQHPESSHEAEKPNNSQRGQHKRSISAPIPAPFLLAALQPPAPQQQEQTPSILATPSIINSVQPRQAIQPIEAIYTYNEKPTDHDIVEQSPQGRYVRFVEKLGSGAYKDVYRAYDTIEGIEVAWNQVNLSGLPKGDKARIINEVRLLERLHHANIISFHGSWVNREKEQVIFVTEILSSGTLKSFINKVKVIRWRIAKRWAIQILKGLEYLHSQDPPIIHRDLKCDNIFINGATGDLRIGDLGLSTVISRKTKVCRFTKCNTYIYSYMCTYTRMFLLGLRSTLCLLPTLCDSYRLLFINQRF